MNNVINPQVELFIDPDLNFGEDKQYVIKMFVGKALDLLEIIGEFKLFLTDKREKYGIKTSAFYRDRDKFMCIYAKDRLTMDIIRSIAHEMVHKKQYEQDRIKHPVQDVGGKIEDEANSVAGQLVKIFIKYYDHEGLILA